jgi:hypothetical protein
VIKPFSIRQLQNGVCRIFFRTNIFLILASIPAISFADSPGLFVIVKHKPAQELWLNPGFYSYHFQKDKGLNNSNFGLGGEYRYSTVSSFTLGLFDNSDRQTSHYAGWYWQPIGIGPVRAGAVFGALDGYPNMLNGGWFLAAIPAASIEYHNFGANILFMPSYKNRLYGAISFQLKLRVY